MKRLLKFATTLLLTMFISGCNKKTGSMIIIAHGLHQDRLGSHDIYIFTDHISYEKGPGYEMLKKKTDEEGMVLITNLKEGYYYAACYFETPSDGILRSGGKMKCFADYLVNNDIYP